MNSKGKEVAHGARLYSIAASRYGDNFDGKTTSLCVRRATYWCPELKAEDPAKKGLCSNFLCDAKPGDEVTLTGALCGCTLLRWLIAATLSQVVSHPECLPGSLPGVAALFVSRECLYVECACWALKVSVTGALYCTRRWLLAQLSWSVPYLCNMRLAVEHFLSLLLRPAWPGWPWCKVRDQPQS